MTRQLSLLVFLLIGISSAGEWENFSLRENGTFPVWTVCGPFPNGRPEFHSDGCFGFVKDFLAATGGEKLATPRENDIVKYDNEKQIAWVTAFSENSGLLDFNEIFHLKGSEPGVAYAFCQLVAGEEKTVILWVRSNDGVKFWLNGELAHENHVGRTIEQAEDRIEIRLKKGKNPLLIKVDQGGGKWGLSVRVTDMQQEIIPSISLSVFRETPLKNRIESIAVKTTPLIQNTESGERQIINVDILSGGLTNIIVTLKKNEWKQDQQIKIAQLHPGKNTIQLKVPVIKKTEEGQLQVSSDGKVIKTERLTLDQVKEYTIYLVQHVHTDIGYTRPQTEILPEHLRFIDYALDFCDLTDDYPDDAKFRWTCEVTWPVREYLKRRPPGQIKRLINRVKEGRIEVAGMFLNMSELSSEDALTASLQPIKEIRNAGIPVTTAMQNDVNGIGWGLVDYFDGIGIRYVNMGINKTRSVLPFDKPTCFWWESPSGKRVLAYRADHYHVGNYWKMHDGLTDYFKQGFLEYLASMENIGYPYKQIVVQYSGYHTDNSPPSTFACDLVKQWNETYLWPKLRMATASEFLQDIEKKHGNDLPVYRAAWPDWWTDGFGSAARETAEARITQNELQTSEGLLAMASLLGAGVSQQTIERAAAVQDALLFYQEHTFGASESISDPMAVNSMIQWGEKSSYVWEAVKNQGLLREEALGLIQPYISRTTEPTIVVFNTLGWIRSGLVKIFIDHEIIPEGANFKILDSENGKEVFAQPESRRNEGTYWTIWIPDIPALGYKSFRIRQNPDGSREQADKTAGSTTLENDYYKISLDSESGAMSVLIDKELGLDLVDKKADYKIGQFIYERLPQSRDFYREAFIRTSLRNVKIGKIEDGLLWQSINVEADAEGCENPGGLAIEYRLYKPEKRIEIFYRIKKKGIQTPEACYVAFPFALKDAEIRYEAQGGLVTPGKNQLPGSASDWQTVQRYSALGGEEGQIILGSPQVPLVQFGDLNLGKWQYITEIKNPYVFSWVMNNYWFTNFRASQEGEFHWHYFLTSTANHTNHFAGRFGWNSSTPLVARVLTAGKNGSRSNQRSLFNLENENILLVNARPVQGGVLIHLREIEGKNTNLQTNFNPDLENISLVNVLGEEISAGMHTLSFKPYEVKFVKLSRPSQE